MLKAEGVRIPPEALVAELSEAVADMKHHVEVRATVLGHIVRGGNPTFRDRMLASRFGLVAVQAILADESGVMACWSTSDRGEPTKRRVREALPARLGPPRDETPQRGYLRPPERTDPSSGGHPMAF